MLETRLASPKWNFVFFVLELHEILKFEGGFWWMRFYAFCVFKFSYHIALWWKTCSGGSVFTLKSKFLSWRMGFKSIPSARMFAACNTKIKLLYSHFPLSVLIVCSRKDALTEDMRKHFAFDTIMQMWLYGTEEIWKRRGKHKNTSCPSNFRSRWMVITSVW